MVQLEQEAILKDFFILLASCICIFLLIFLYIKNSKIKNADKNNNKYPHATGYWLDKFDPSIDWRIFKEDSFHSAIHENLDHFWQIDLFSLNRKIIKSNESIYSQCKEFIPAEWNKSIEHGIVELIKAIDSKYKVFFEKNSAVKLIHSSALTRGEVKTWVETPMLLCSVGHFFLESIISFAKKLDLTCTLNVKLEKGFFLIVNFSKIERKILMSLRIFAEELNTMINVHSIETENSIEFILCLVYSELEIPHYLEEKLTSKKQK